MSDMEVRERARSQSMPTEDDRDVFPPLGLNREDSLFQVELHRREKVLLQAGLESIHHHSREHGCQGPAAGPQIVIQWANGFCYRNYCRSYFYISKGAQ